LFSLSSPKEDPGFAEARRGGVRRPIIQAQIPSPQPSPRSGGERESVVVSSCARRSTDASASNFVPRFETTMDRPEDRAGIEHPQLLRHRPGGEIAANDTRVLFVV
jgi:hypothetical protein